MPVVERIKVRLRYGTDGEVREHALYLVRLEVGLLDVENFACMVRIEYGGGV